MLKEINFFDDHHSKYSSENNEEDLSSIIAYMLTSDKYREFISPNNKLKLIDIKCERKEKVPFDCLQYVRENMKKEFKCMFEMQGQFKSNTTVCQNDEESKNLNIPGLEEEVYETSLLFDQTKNVYYYQNLENHKIYQQLETELLSDEKNHFNFQTSNSNIMNTLTTLNLPIEYMKNKLESSMSNINHSNSSNIKISRDRNDTERTHDTPIVHSNSIIEEERCILKGDDIKSTLEDLEKAKKELRTLKESNNQISDNKIKIKGKKLEFIEDTIFTPLEYEIIAYYPRQFEVLRITYCATYDEFILSVYKKFIFRWQNHQYGLMYQEVNQRQIFINLTIINLY
jgi:hypothetical protein